MAPRVDIVGHFGTTYSYATVASEVAKALRDADILGTVSNLDEAWHDEHLHLKRHGLAQGTHVVVFTAPNHYIDAFASQYGRRNAALYVSPNTDTFAPEHAETCAKFGMAIAPSRWCKKVVAAGITRSAEEADTEIVVLPLGVPSRYSAHAADRAADLAKRCSAAAECRVLHVSTDQCWPGRKGTEELFEAWALLQQQGLINAPDGRSAHLTVHVPNALAIPASFLARDLDIDESVTIERATLKGSSDKAMLKLFDETDVVVAPSRCEGFGMMLLATLVARVPLVATYNTGHADFMREMGGWLGVSCASADDLVFELGKAPVVDKEVLARSLYLATMPEVRLALLTKMDTAVRDWTWPSILPQWVGELQEWSKETRA